MSESTDAVEAYDEDNPERLYVLTGGRSASPDKAPLDLVTLIVARSRPVPGMQPEHTAILQLCHSPLSVAEISAYLSLPFGVVSVLITDLLNDKHVEARAPIPAALLPDVALIEAVMHGLQKL